LSANTGGQHDAREGDAASTRQPSPAMQAWMDRLSVAHAYDPATGFIVAKEIIGLPPLLSEAPPLDEAIAEADGRIVIVFATADRCAPCQQFKHDALNDPAVVAALGDPRFLPTHLEVDKRGDLADRYLGGRAIPMSYAILHGERIDALRGQRSAEDVLTWLGSLGD